MAARDSISVRDLLAIPELAALDSQSGMVRVPPELDVPLTPRVRRLLDTAALRRLAGIRQLGLVSLVYPGAVHSRFEHSLGVYRMALVFLRHLVQDERFMTNVTAADAQRFLVAALLHDVGHWPFCHPIEDMKLAELPSHEQAVAAFLHSDEVASALHGDWQIEAESIVELLGPPALRPVDRLLQSLLSGPIDIDKIDYLARDSLHAGVPYGRHFDQGRLVASLCLNAAGNGLAITEKGRTAAELMLFARYVMFSEVYWHHAVRSATAMLQRAFFELLPRLDVGRLIESTDGPFVDALRESSAATAVERLVSGLFGGQRRLYKRLAEYSYFQGHELYAAMARRPFPWLVRCSRHLAEQLAAKLARPVSAEEVLIDAPPVKRETAFDVEVWFAKERAYRRLADISPVVAGFAREEFDDYVKRVRIFVAPELAEPARAIEHLEDLVQAAVDQTDSDSV